MRRTMFIDKDSDSIADDFLDPSHTLRRTTPIRAASMVQEAKPSPDATSKHADTVKKRLPFEFNAFDDERLIAEREFVARCSIGRSSVYQAMKRGRFPQSICINGRSKRWKMSEIRKWMDDPQGYRCKK